MKWNWRALRPKRTVQPKKKKFNFFLFVAVLAERSGRVGFAFFFGSLWGVMGAGSAKATSPKKRREKKESKLSSSFLSLSSPFHLISLIIKEKSEIERRKEKLMGMKFEFGLLFCSRGDYGRQRPHGREPREKTREDKQTQTECLLLSLLFSISWRNERNWEKRERELVCEWNEWNVMWAACLSFLKWNGREENKRGNGMEWMKRRPKQPKAARQAEMESNQTHFIVCVWWMEWKGWVGSSLGG